MQVLELPERLSSRVVVSGTGCWEWQGRRGHMGHGFVNWKGKSTPVYRVTYELLVGPADAQDMDHLCRNPPCCNPAHLEPVSHAENMRRGVQSFDVRTHCLSGRHELTPENVYTRSDGRQQCRLCWRAAKSARRSRRAALGLPYQ